MPRLTRVLGIVLAFAIAAIGVVSAAFAPVAAQDSTPPAADGVEGAEAVPYLDADEREVALLEVTDVVDPFEDVPDDVEPGDEERFTLVSVSVENTGDDPLPLDPVTILLRDTAGFLYGLDADLQDALAADPDAEPLLEADDVAPGDDIEGTIGFAVDENADLSEVLFVPETGRLIVLADLGEPGGLGGVDGDDATEVDDNNGTPARTPRARRSQQATTTPTADATADADDSDDDVDTDPTPTDAPPAPIPPTEAPAPAADSDGDGLTDDQEATLGTDPAAADTDGDGLIDGDESNVGTDPFVPDSDGDGVLDGDEVLTVGTDPFSADTDGDGLGDADETIAGTDPFTGDTDGDGLTDGEEVVRGSDPLAAAEGTTEPTVEETAEATAEAEPDATEAPDATEPAGGTDDGVDSDGDGLTDAEEAALGTDPTVVDTDADGLPDGDEQNAYGTNPLLADTDGDGTSDLNDVITATQTPTS